MILPLLIAINSPPNQFLAIGLNAAPIKPSAKTSSTPYLNTVNDLLNHPARLLQWRIRMFTKHLQRITGRGLFGYFQSSEAVQLVLPLVEKVQSRGRHAGSLL